ncbi:hypothetical protein M441DRAFT_43580 [Trichoderma asperellum CBS 433.97]|uniref:Uncharacterized protein n=1 Tax=Trichoderma asperellum (strain ATCC 204424 / CBS 433.97 / NBRC 101777) TaxID=1042311 RepID=A0A2T3ZL69_TRIA4|nr:hypothetical protein M441DRAFT_43580 [Trichoderma asperellum CBS 433.97]PTB45557.1 hypothetical protein M441DRAFT_43580 [Trichoderma asperellum CBS 433.97]
MACSNDTEQGEEDTRESEIGPSRSRSPSTTDFIMLPVINQSSGLCCAPASLMAMCKSSAYCLYPRACRFTRIIVLPTHAKVPILVLSGCLRIAISAGIRHICIREVQYLCAANGCNNANHLGNFDTVYRSFQAGVLVIFDKNGVAELYQDYGALSLGSAQGRAKVWSTRIIACRNLAPPYASGGMDKYLRHWPKVTQYIHAHMVTRAEFGRRRLATRPHDREGGLSGAEFFFWTGNAVTAGMLGRCLCVVDFFWRLREKGTAPRDLKASGKGFHGNPRHRPVSCSSSGWRPWYSESHAHEAQLLLISGWRGEARRGEGIHSHATLIMSAAQSLQHILCTRHSCPHHRVIPAARDWPESPSPPSGAEGTQPSISTKDTTGELRGEQRRTRARALGGAEATEDPPYGARSSLGSGPRTLQVGGLWVKLIPRWTYTPSQHAHQVGHYTLLASRRKIESGRDAIAMR